MHLLLLTASCNKWTSRHGPTSDVADGHLAEAQSQVIARRVPADLAAGSSGSDGGWRRAAVDLRQGSSHSRPHACMPRHQRMMTAAAPRSLFER